MSQQCNIDLIRIIGPIWSEKNDDGISYLKDMIVNLQSIICIIYVPTYC